MDRRNFLRTGFLLIGVALLAPVSMVFARTAATPRTAATVRPLVTCGVVLGENGQYIFNEDGTYLCGEAPASRTAR